MADVGSENKKGQKLLQKTDWPGSRPFARTWLLQCTKCGGVYGANSCDFHNRRCPQPNCEYGGGKPGLISQT
jgi:hypothetical protein